MVTVDGDLIQQWLKDRGMKQRFLAAQLGITEHNLCNIIAGRRSFRLSFLVRLADFTGLSTDQLLGRPRRRTSGYTQLKATVTHDLDDGGGRRAEPPAPAA
jgi:plasmid maintenance system antidote protein VapI